MDLLYLSCEKSNKRERGFQIRRLIAARDSIRSSSACKMEQQTRMSSKVKKIPFRPIICSASLISFPVHVCVCHSFSPRWKWESDHWSTWWTIFQVSPFLLFFIFCSCYFNRLVSLNDIFLQKIAFPLIFACSIMPDKLWTRVSEWTKDTRL